MTKLYDLAIIGGGSAGLVAAAMASGMGANVLLVEKRKMGGDCLNYGCVPSKAFLKASRLAYQIKHSADYGIKVDNAEISLAKIMARVQDVIAEIAVHDSVERFESLGVEVVLGGAAFVDPCTIEVNGQNYQAKKFLIAAGSSAFVPPIKGLDQIDYYTNETIFGMQDLPEKLIVLGAGPIGLELGQGFANLGSKVAVFDRSPAIFGKDEPEVAPIMEQALNRSGLELFTNCSILAVEKKGQQIALKIEIDGKEQTYLGDAMLVALGRAANTKGLNLDEIGIATDSRGFIIVNDKLQTNIAHIFAAGDIRGKFQFTHTASYEAAIAVRNALVRPIFKTKYYNLAWTTYTIPEVAHVGYLEEQAKQDGLFGSAYSLPIDNNDRAKAENDRLGLVKIILDTKGIVIGATIVGEKAGEMLPVLSLMVTEKIKLKAALGMIYQYPIQGEIVKALALNHFKDNIKPWQQNMIKQIIK